MMYLIGLPENMLFVKTKSKCPSKASCILFSEEIVV